MDTPISRAEHEEFRRSMEQANENLAAENRRQNKRLDALEKNERQITELTVSVRELAVNMQSMTAELARQGTQMEQQAQQTGERLTKLEGRDGEKYRRIAGYIISSIVTVLVGFIFGRFF